MLWRLNILEEQWVQREWHQIDGSADCCIDGPGCRSAGFFAHCGKI